VRWRAPRKQRERWRPFRQAVRSRMDATEERGREESGRNTSMVHPVHHHAFPLAPRSRSHTPHPGPSTAPPHVSFQRPVTASRAVPPLLTWGPNPHAVCDLPGRAPASSWRTGLRRRRASSAWLLHGRPPRPAAPPRRSSPSFRELRAIIPS